MEGGKLFKKWFQKKAMFILHVLFVLLNQQFIKAAAHTSGDSPQRTSCGPDLQQSPESLLIQRIRMCRPDGPLVLKYGLTYLESKIVHHLEEAEKALCEKWNNNRSLFERYVNQMVLTRNKYVDDGSKDKILEKRARNAENVALEKRMSIRNSLGSVERLLACHRNANIMDPD